MEKDPSSVLRHEALLSCLLGMAQGTLMGPRFRAEEHMWGHCRAEASSGGKGPEQGPIWQQPTPSLPCPSEIGAHSPAGA